MPESRLTIPAVSQRWRRLALLIGGLTIFFWMRLEDHGVTTVVIMGVIAAFLAGLFWLWPRLAARSWKPLTLLLAATASGALLGASASLMTAFLMLLKNGFHGHLNPDYSAVVIGETLALLPAWAVAGGLLAAAASLVWMARAR